MAKSNKVKFPVSGKKCLSIREATDAHQVLNALIEADKANKYVLPSSVRISFLVGNTRKTAPVVEGFMAENNRLVEKYGEKEVVKHTVDGVEKDVETGKFKISADSKDWAKFSEEYKAMIEEDADIVLRPAKPFELSGVSEAEYNDPKSDPKKQNQIPTELIQVMFNVGLLVD